MKTSIWPTKMPTKTPAFRRKRRSLWCKHQSHQQPKVRCRDRKLQSQHRSQRQQQLGYHHRKQWKWTPPWILMMLRMMMISQWSYPTTWLTTFWTIHSHPEIIWQSRRSHHYTRATVATMNSSRPLRSAIVAFYSHAKGNRGMSHLVNVIISQKYKLIHHQHCIRTHITNVRRCKADWVAHFGGKLVSVAKKSKSIEYIDLKKCVKIEFPNIGLAKVKEYITERKYSAKSWKTNEFARFELLLHTSSNWRSN